MRLITLKYITIGTVILLSACGSNDSQLKEQAELMIKAPTSLVFGGNDATLSATGGSGDGELTYNLGNSTGCVLTGGKLSLSDTSGTCIINVSKAADDNYNAATSPNATVELLKAQQNNLTINAPASLTFDSDNASATLSTKGGSGNGVISYSAGNSKGCTLTGDLLSATLAGELCSVQAIKAADNNYHEASSNNAIVNIMKGPHRSQIYIQPIANLPTDFIKGADISSLLEVEENGGVFYNEVGVPTDAITLLADHGVNWIRLRLWNNPYDVSWIKEVTGFDVQGASGGGTNDLSRTIILAKRAKAAGLKILLDFHYSDFWTHPGQQFMPDAWVGLSKEDVEKALYEFTYNNLIEMNNQDVFPDMVQIGNEINSGLVAPQGNGLTSENAIALLKQGSKAVRDAAITAKNETKIMVHLANGGDNGAFTWAFDAFTQANLDYDIIGASYYPYWHGTLSALQFNLDTISKKYNKHVIVVETAYGFTTEPGPDDLGNIFNQDTAITAGFAGTVLGQATAMREIMNVVAEVPNELGQGIFYWEPTWLAVGETGWVSGAKNAWENQAMFDYTGKVLDSMDVFWRVSENKTVAAPTLISIFESNIVLKQGDELDLPTQVSALFSDDSFRKLDVTWDNADSINSDTVGTYMLNGVVANTNIPATVNVTISPKSPVINKGALDNYSFETGAAEPWIISDGTAGLAITEKTDEVHAGNFALHFWSEEPQNQSVSQTKNNIPNGTYTISAWFMGSSNGVSNSMLSATSGENTVSMPIAFKGWNNWFEITFDIEVTGNTLNITVNIDEEASSWGNIDEVSAVILP